MDIKQCYFKTEEEMHQLVDLQNEVYKKRRLHFNSSTFQSWYIDNPNGEVISFNAFENSRMVAHQSFVPEEMLVSGRVVKCVRSMAVVTHPDYQGQGLFATVTNKALEEAKRQGFEFAYAISNANSTPVFLKHCGFKQIAQLQLRIGFGNDVKENGSHIYKRHWSPESLKWRTSINDYTRQGNNVIGDYKYGVKTYMATLDEALLDKVCLPQKHSIAPRLYVGLGAKISAMYMKLPKFIKHSPFNLIFQDLTGGKLPKMTPDNVFYQLLDYDVT